MLEKAELMVVANVFMAAVAPKAIRQATSAYSMRSWPDSSIQTSETICLRVFIVRGPLILSTFRYRDDEYAKRALVYRVVMLSVMGPQRHDT